MRLHNNIELTLPDDGDVDVEITHRAQSRWTHWKSISGVLFGRRISSIED